MSNIVRQHAVNIQCEDKTRNIHVSDDNKLMKGKALRKYSLHEKTAAPALLKPFISSNE